MTDQSAAGSGDAAPASGGSPGSPEKPGPSVGSIIPRRQLLLDLTPLRVDREYRKLWIGQVISVMGNQVTRIALPFQVYVLTGSPLSIAVLTAVQLLPILIFGLAAGSIADAFDRRKVLIVTQVGLAITNVGLVLISIQESPPVWALYVMAGIAGGLLSVDWPARLAAVPRLVPRERLPSAIGLTQLSHNTSAIVGPAIGGVILATTGVAGAYLTDLIAFGISIWALILLKPILPLHQTVAPGLTAIREGLSFVRSKKIILGAFAIDLNAMVFGRPIGLFPILALEVFKTGPAGVGMLAAAPAVGAFIGAVLSGWLTSIRHTGRAVILSVVGWGILVTLFGLSTFSFELALVLLAMAGAADVLSTMLRWTIVQTETPDHLRGRVTSINNMSVTSGPRLGDIRATTVASLIGAQASVVSGGLLVLVGAVLTARAFPALTSHRLRLRRHESDGGGEGPEGGGSRGSESAASTEPAPGAPLAPPPPAARSPAARSAPQPAADNGA